MAVRNSFHFQRTLTKEVTEVFKEAVNIFSNQISCSIKMVISTQKCRTSSGIAKHLKNDITKIRKKTSLAHAKPLILQFDTFLIAYVYIIFYFIFARLGCTRLQRGKMEYWYLARKETCCLSHQCSSCRRAVHLLQKVIAFGLFLGCLPVLKTLQALRERVPLSRGAGSPSCQPLKDFLTYRTPCQSGSLME